MKILLASFAALSLSSMSLASAESCRYGCQATVQSGGEEVHCSGGIATFLNNTVPDGYTGFCRGDINFLYLGPNQLSNLPAGVFDMLPKETLDLDGNQLLSLPAGVFDKLYNLQFLYLDGNQLSSLPAGVFDKLPILRTLSLSGNQLSSLPAGVFDMLPNLQNLVLGGNKISSYPHFAFVGLSSLQGVSLDPPPPSCPSGAAMIAATTAVPAHCEANPVPCLYGCRGSMEEGGRVKCTGGISAFNNSFVPPGFANFCSSLLRGVDLQSNNIRMLPSNVFFNMTSVISLSLYGNPLTRLPYHVFNAMTSLQSLNLSFTELDALSPNVFDRLSGLTSLDSSSTKLEGLPSNVFDRLSGLTFLDLEGNHIEVYPRGIFNFNPFPRPDRQKGEGLFLDLHPAVCPSHSDFAPVVPGRPAHCEATVSPPTSATVTPLTSATDPTRPNPSKGDTSLSAYSNGTIVAASAAVVVVVLVLLVYGYRRGRAAPPPSFPPSPADDLDNYQRHDSIDLVDLNGEEGPWNDLKVYRILQYIYLEIIVDPLRKYVMAVLEDLFNEAVAASCRSLDVDVEDPGVRDEAAARYIAGPLKCEWTELNFNQRRNPIENDYHIGDFHDLGRMFLGPKSYKHYDTFVLDAEGCLQLLQNLPQLRVRLEGLSNDDQKRTILQQLYGVRTNTMHQTTITRERFQSNVKALRQLTSMIPSDFYSKYPTKAQLLSELECDAAYYRELLNRVLRYCNVDASVVTTAPSTVSVLHYPSYVLSDGYSLLVQDLLTRSSPPTVIPLSILRRWTSDFAPSLLVGEGSFGKVYQGSVVCVSGEATVYKEIAVKCITPKESSSAAAVLKSYSKERLLLSTFKHDNIITLLGYCQEGGGRAGAGAGSLYLVYEYAVRGDLSYVLHESGGPLSYKQRIRIALGVAKGLHYMHTKEKGNPAFHRDVKSANIVLDESFSPKIIDYGFSHYIPLDEDRSRTTLNSSTGSEITKTRKYGTEPYKCPWYQIAGNAYCVKSEVYSFGVVLAELLTGKPPAFKLPNGTVTYLSKEVSHLPVDGRVRDWPSSGSGSDGDGEGSSKSLRDLCLQCLAPFETRLQSFQDVIEYLTELQLKSREKAPPAGGSSVSMAGSWWTRGYSTVE